MVKEQPGGEAPYERLSGDTIASDEALFTYENAIEAAWPVVDPRLNIHNRAIPYQRGSWELKETAGFITLDGTLRYHSPVAS